jgi:protein-disulfide isomerase
MMNKFKKYSPLLTLLAGLVVGAGLYRSVSGGPTRAVADTGKPAAAAPAAAPAAPAVAQRVEDPKAVYRVPVDGTPMRGPREAPITIVEVTDFECPFCKRAEPTMKELDKAYPGKLRFSFRHNPLSFHETALPAAVAAEVAREQGGDAMFWAMHDKLFAIEKLDTAALLKAGQEVGLDEAKLKAALQTGSKQVERIRVDQSFVVPLGANGTPTFFVNGRKVVGALPFEAFKAVIDEELQKAEALVKSGVAPKDVYARTIEKGATSPVTMAAPAAAQAAPVAATAAVVPLRADDPVKGPALAPVTIVVFSDFQCPFCSRVEPTLKQVEQAFPGKVRFTWRHQPLPFHPNAMPAARAAEAARVQGKFWEMHDKLFADQQALSDATYSKYAKELGLDLARFQKDAASEAAGKRIADDQALAAKVGASGTPTMFVNCRLISGAQPFEKFKAMVEEELKKVDAAVARGDKLDAGFYDKLCAANVASAPAVAAAPPPRTDVKVALRADDPARGPAGAKVTVVEFSDFQCPFCSRAVPAVKELEQAFGKDVRVVWKHLPLSFHPNAMPAALAAEAAREQGKFWEMHDKLFANQQALSEAAYDQYAAELRLDLPSFKAARQAPETKKRVEADLAVATAAGVTGTPTFVVNGEVVVGSAALKPAVERQLKKGELVKR